MASPLKAIREKCIDCCAGSLVEVRECELKSCALHPFRMGKNSENKRQLSDDQISARVERLKAAREVKAANNIARAI